MIGAFCQWVWNQARDGGKKFFLRVFLFCAGVMLFFSLIIFLLCLLTFDLGFMEHWFVLLLFVIIAIGSGTAFASLFRSLVTQGLARALTKFEDIPSGNLRQMDALAARLDYRALEDKLMRSLHEQRSDEIARAHTTLLAQARYPWYTAPVLLDRIQSDENAQQMRGRSKETVIVLLSLPNASGLSLDPEKANFALRKVMARTLGFARSTGMMLIQFSLESSVLVADIPYSVSRPLKKRLPVLCRKWIAQIADLLEEIEYTGSASCYLHFGDIAYGRMQADSRSAFIVDTQAWQELVTAERSEDAKRGDGVLVSEAYCKYAGINCENPDLVTNLSPSWFLLKD
ncbi:MAG: hypothetical protein LBC99_08455 [Spirochaetota bacterium]|jgi:hypothetical protein|nr:hypothetical protein [Spirochaetota bacterium]